MAKRGNLKRCMVRLKEDRLNSQRNLLSKKKGLIVTEKVTNIFAEDLISGSLLLFIGTGFMGIFLALAVPSDAAANPAIPYGGHQNPDVVFGGAAVKAPQKAVVFDDSGLASKAMSEQAHAWAMRALDDDVLGVLGTALYLDKWRKYTLNDRELTVREYKELKLISAYYQEQIALSQQ